MVTIIIDIISDITCVWCYIGSRTLSHAISLYQKTYPGGKHDNFKVTWHPYYLNPTNLNGHSVDKTQLMQTRLASWSPEKIATAENRVLQVGRSVGIDFRFGGKIGSTRVAHRLIWLCQGEIMAGKMGWEVRDRFVEGVFEAYHVKEEDISERGVLSEIAVDAGIDRTMVDEWLENDMGGTAVDKEAVRNREVTTAGVPFFTIQDEYHVDGAQDLQEFLEIFIKVREFEDRKKM